MSQSAGWFRVPVVIVCAVALFPLVGRGQGAGKDMDLIHRDADAAAIKGESAKAVSLYVVAISAEPDSAWAHRGLADCYRVNGAWAKAAEQYEAVAKLDPNDTDAARLASLMRRAVAEQQEDVVKSDTYSAIEQFSLSWLPKPAAAPRPPVREGDGASRSLHMVLNQAPAAATSVVSIPVEVAFSRNQYTLNEKAIRQLTEVVASINAGSERPDKIEVDGHTCTCGSAEGNIELGRRRAGAVRDFLVSKGVAPASRFTTVSFGASRPVESAGAPDLPASVCERDSIHSENRRVVIMVYSAAAGAAPPPPPLDVSFLSSRTGGNNFAVLADGGRVHSGDRYLIRLHAPNLVYAYVFHRDATGSWSAFAPGTVPDASSAPLDLTFEIVGKTGLEETVIYSRLEPDKDLDSLVKQINAAPEDKGFHDLRAPELPDLPEPEPKRVTHGQPPVVDRKVSDPSVPVIKNGTFDDHQDESTPKPDKPTTAPASEQHQDPAGKTGRQSVEMRGLAMIDPGAKDSRQLPPDPSAWLRFNHVQ